VDNIIMKQNIYTCGTYYLYVWNKLSVPVEQICCIYGTN
jgi:hypothetical protein